MLKKEFSRLGSQGQRTIKIKHCHLQNLFYLFLSFSFFEMRSASNFQLPNYNQASLSSVYIPLVTFSNECSGRDRVNEHTDRLWKFLHQLPAIQHFCTKMSMLDIRCHFRSLLKLSAIHTRPDVKYHERTLKLCLHACKYKICWFVPLSLQGFDNCLEKRKYNRQRKL